VALHRHGIATTLLAGDATPPGLELAARYGLPADACAIAANSQLRGGTLKTIRPAAAAVNRSPGQTLTRS
jgi:hypothetical protein